jgi:hypothetical protein
VHDYGWVRRHGFRRPGHRGVLRLGPRHSEAEAGKCPERFKSIGEYCTDLEQRLTALGHSPQAQPIVGHGHQALSPRDLKRAVTDRFYKVINEDETGRVYVGVDLENHVEVVVNCTEGGMDAWSSFTTQTDAELHELIDALMDANFKAKGQ